MPKQTGLFGDSVDVPVKERDRRGWKPDRVPIRQRVKHILEDYPAARNDYSLVFFYYWLRYDGLYDLMHDLYIHARAIDHEPNWTDYALAAFRQWLCKATSPKTIQNRAMEVQNDHPGLEASPTTEKWRQRQAKAGPVL